MKAPVFILTNKEAIKRMKKQIKNIKILNWIPNPKLQQNFYFTWNGKKINMKINFSTVCIYLIRLLLKDFI